MPAGEICFSTCDICYYRGPGVMNFSRDNHPYLFQCLLCVPFKFERIHERDKERRSCDPQDEKPASVQLRQYLLPAGYRYSFRSQ